MFMVRFGSLLGGLFGAAVVMGMFHPVYAQNFSLSVPQNRVLVSSHDAENPQELFEGATRLAMKALELLIKTLPQYDPPVVLKNGDILIRRKRPQRSVPKEGDPPDRERI